MFGEISKLHVIILSSPAGRIEGKLHKGLSAGNLKGCAKRIQERRHLIKIGKQGQKTENITK